MPVIKVGKCFSKFMIEKHWFKTFLEKASDVAQYYFAPEFVQSI